jgi:cell division protein FtsI (penicillin-binding protein 3)
MVLVDEPESNVYGGVVAAPVFRNIARGALRHLAVAPQKLELVPTAIGPADFPRRRAVKRETEVAFDRGAAAVPDFVGLSLREAVEKARAMRVKVKMHGNGYVIRQSPVPGQRWSEEDILVLNLQG